MMDAGSVKFISETITRWLSVNLFAKVKVKNLHSLNFEITMKISYYINLFIDLHKATEGCAWWNVFGPTCYMYNDYGKR